MNGNGADRIVGTIQVCSDCLQMAANGEVEGECDREPLGLLVAGEYTIGTTEHVCSEDVRESGDCECESYGFSWSQCEGCGSSLGGDRFAMTVWESS